MNYVRATLRSITAFLLVACVLMPTSRVHAENGLTVSPPLKELVLSPGLISANFDVTLKNTSGTVINASYQLVDLKALGQYGGNTLGQAGLPDAYNLANWITLASPAKQKINSGETAIIKVKVDNRTDLSPGGHYGAIIITTSADNAQSSLIDLNQQLISLVFVKKLGGENYGLDLESFSPNKSGRVPDAVDLHFKSTGNVHVTPRGFIEVTDPKGKLIAKGIINPDSAILLPGASRKLVSIVQPVSNSSAAGKYRITVYYRYEGEDEYMTKSVYFTKGNDYKLVSIIAITLMLLTGISGKIWWKKHNKKHKKSTPNE